MTAKTITYEPTNSTVGSEFIETLEILMRENPQPAIACTVIALFVVCWFIKDVF